MSDKIAVTVPVSATLGKFRAVLVPFQVVDDGPEDCIERPWAWLGNVDITFWIGKRRVTKRLKARACLPASDGDWHEREEAPNPDERRAMFAEMVAEMRRHLEAHGLDVDLIGWEVTS